MVDESSDDLASPGWYQDSTIEGHQRYWDGTAWTGPSVPIENDQTSRPSGAFDSTLIFVLVGLLMVGGCGITLIGVPRLLGNEDGNPTEIPMATTTEDFAFTTTGPPPPPILDDAITTTQTTATTSQPAVVFGSPMTTPSNIGSSAEPSIWEITVDRPVDVTEAVLAANPLEPQSLDHVRFAAIPVTLTLAESAGQPIAIDGLLDGLNVVFEGASTGAGYVPDTDTDNPFGCEAIAELPATEGELLPGDSITTSICIQVPTTDLDHGNSRVLIWLGDGPGLVWIP